MAIFRAIHLNIFLILRMIPFQTNTTLSDLFSYLSLSFFVALLLFSGYFLLYWALKKQEINDELTHKVRRKLQLPFALLLVLLSLWLPLFFIEVSEMATYVANKVSVVLIILLLAWMLIQFVHLVKVVVLKRYKIEAKDNLKARKVYTQFNIIERVLVFLVVLVAFSLILMSFGEIRKIGVSLIASAGLTGIVLGLAAQKVLGGILAGIQIALTQPIRYDDVVIVENEWGRIEEITLTYVVVKIWDERRLVVPTTYFIEKPFQNWTRTSASILGTVFLHTDYAVPFDALRDELTRLLEASPLWDKRVNVLQVTDAKERTVEIRALMSAEDSPTAWDLRVYVREGLITFLQENYPESLPRTRVVLNTPANAHP